MRFLSFDVGERGGGDRVRVDLRGTEANVLLLDDANLASYRAGRRFEYFGGHATRSPVILQVPRAAHWHDVVDLCGAGGSVDASVRVLAAW